MRVGWVNRGMWMWGVGPGRGISLGASVAGQVGGWSAKAWGQWLTDVPQQRVIGLHLPAPDDIPDTGHPVGEKRKGGREQREHHSTALRVPLQLLQQPQQPQQPHCLQQVHQRGLQQCGGRGRLSEARGPSLRAPPLRPSPAPCHQSPGARGSYSRKNISVAKKVARKCKGVGGGG